MDPWVAATPGLAAFLVGFAVAAMVYLAAPRRPQNRLLSVALVFEGTAMLTFSGLLLSPDLPTTIAFFSLNNQMAALVGVVYLAFLGTLDSPLSRPLSPTPVRRALLVIAGILLVGWPAFYEFGRTEYAILFLGVVLVFGALVATTAFMRAPRGTLARRQAAVILVAFGARDLSTAAILLDLAPAQVGALSQTLFPLISLTFFLLIGYAMLTMSLFDIDLRVKRGLRTGSVAAVFVAVFFVATTVVSEWLSQTWGFLVGGAISGLLLLAVAPMQRAAERVADTLMPQVRDTPEYVARRKVQIFRAAVDGALADGAITEREREILRRLQLELGISNEEARQMEEEARSSAA